MPPYTRNTWVDEVWASVRYNILEDGGGAFKSTMQLVPSTSPATPGTTLNAARANNIEGEIQALSDFLQYKLAVSVVSNDLVVTLQHSDGTNPTSTRPLWFLIGGVWRSVTTTTTITIADGTNWFNSGSAQLATLIAPYFAYVVWDSNSSVVALTIARIPYAQLVSDFSGTTTSQYHCFNHANFTTTDNVENIGYFEATNSGSASYLWTVPTFTNANLKHVPTYLSRFFLWAAAAAGFSAVPTNAIYEYQMIGRDCKVRYREGTNGTSNSTSFSATAPFTAKTVTNGLWTAFFSGIDNTAFLTTPSLVTIASNSATMTFYLTAAAAAASWTGSGGKRATYFELSYPIA